MYDETYTRQVMVEVVLLYDHLSLIVLVLVLVVVVVAT
jgi:hypothetical protein